MRALTFAPEQIFPVGARHVYPGPVGAGPLLGLPLNVSSLAMPAIPACVVPGFSPASFSGSGTGSGRSSGRCFLFFPGPLHV
jgi:hypothetical protein